VKRFAEEAGLALDPSLVCELPGQVNPFSAYDSGILLTRKLVADKREFSAVLAFDDLTALGVIRGLHQCGLRVPDDCSVTGFDDVFPAAVSLPSVTTIRQSMTELGQTSARCVMEALQAKEDGNEMPVQIHTFPPTLIARDSTAPYKKKATAPRAKAKRESSQ